MGLPESGDLRPRATDAFPLVGNGVTRQNRVRGDDGPEAERVSCSDGGTGAPGEKRVTYDRSAVMRAVKSRDTSPERAVRALLRLIAPGYRLHRADLPGKPDIVYASRKLVIFVQGCFWHGHNCARGARSPKTNAEYWRAKIAHNRDRDIRTLAAYAAMGWRTLVVYECELKDKASLSARFAEALRTQEAATGKCK
jgi:DNA mismatch endonuclease (patch repair protein)